MRFPGGYLNIPYTTTNKTVQVSVGAGDAAAAVMQSARLSAPGNDHTRDVTEATNSGVGGMHGSAAVGAASAKVATAAAARVRSAAMVASLEPTVSGGGRGRGRGMVPMLHGGCMQPAVAVGSGLVSAPVVGRGRGRGRGTPSQLGSFGPSLRPNRPHADVAPTSSTAAAAPTPTHAFSGSGFWTASTFSKWRMATDVTTQVDALLAMGFESQKVHVALAMAKGNLDSAIELIVSGELDDPTQQQRRASEPESATPSNAGSRWADAASLPRLAAPSQRGVGPLSDQPAAIAKIPEQVAGLLAALNIANDDIHSYMVQSLEMIAYAGLSADDGTGERYDARRELSRLAEHLADHTDEEDIANIEAMLVSMLL